MSQNGSIIKKLITVEILLLLLIFLLIIWVCYYFLKAVKSPTFDSPTSVILPQTSKEDQRKHPRMKVRWPVSMETPDGIVEAEIKDISLGGAFICCDKPLPVGEIFRLTMKVPDKEPIEATAKAVWSNLHIPKEKVIYRGMGVQFIKMSDKHIQFVRGIFRENEKSKK